VSWAGEGPAAPAFDLAKATAKPTATSVAAANANARPNLLRRLRLKASRIPLFRDGD
jgi:hypothetical protein